MGKWAKMNKVDKKTIMCWKNFRKKDSEQGYKVWENRQSRTRESCLKTKVNSALHKSENQEHSGISLPRTRAAKQMYWYVVLCVGANNEIKTKLRKSQLRPDRQIQTKWRRTLWCRGREKTKLRVIQRWRAFLKGGSFSKQKKRIQNGGVRLPWGPSVAAGEESVLWN